VGGGKEESVVGADQDGSCLARFDRDRSTLGADTWIDHREYDRIPQPRRASP
jgi:hypothetical protein